MKSTGIKLPFGLNKNNDLVHIADVEKGKKCDCICPGCRSPLTAAKGNINQHHFRHSVDKECPGGLESAIHMAAKKMLLEKKQITLPEHKVKLEGKDSRGIAYLEEETAVIGGTVVQFDTVQDEVELHEMKFDILAKKSNTPLAIEIFYRHRVDEVKFLKIVKANISAIEIDLSDLTPNDVNNWETFWESINNPQRINWIYNAKASDGIYRRLESRLEKAIQSEEKKYTQEKIEREKKYLARNKQIEKDKSDLKISLEKLMFLRSLEYAEQLRQKAKNYMVQIPNQQLSLSLNELPYYLNIEVPDGDWIFGCERRIWQSAFYNAFVCNGEKRHFSIKEVHDWLKEKAGCRVPRDAVVVGIHGKSYPALLPGNLGGELPSSWRTLRAYFDHLCKLGMLKSYNSDHSQKRSSSYGILSKTPFGSPDK